MHSKKSGQRKKVYIPLYTVLFYVLLLLWEPNAGMIATLVSALFHELGHYAAACIMGVEVERITVYPFGADMRLSRRFRSYGADIVIASAGAAVNLSLAGMGACLGWGEMIACNLLLAAVNLLPVKGLDGGVILLAAVERIGGRGEKLLRISSFVFLFFLWMAAVYILLILEGDPSLFVLACGLFASVFLRRRKNE